MVQKPKPTKDLVIKVESIKTRLERIKLSNEFKIIGMLNNQMLQIMNLFDWSDQGYIVNGKSGLTDCFGEVMIPADYDETCFRADYFVPREKPIACKKGDKWGMVLPDGKGSVVTDFLYDNIILGDYYSFMNFIIVALEDKYGFIDIKGKSLTPIELDEIYKPESNMGLVRKGEKFGFIYYNGDYIEPVYEEISFCDGDFRCHVKLNDQWGFVVGEKNYISAHDAAEEEELVYYGRIR